MPHPDSIAQRLARFTEEADLAPANIWIDRNAVAAGAASGPLAGLLAAVKDNIDVVGFPTTAACPSFAYEPTRSATVVERLLAAGASVVGKTNLDQFACGLVGTRSPTAPVSNAFKPEYVSGGSSSGSAVAVALGLVDVSYGTDTAGSGRVPAGLNNIVGLKPSRGLMSTRGVVPASQAHRLRVDFRAHRAASRRGLDGGCRSRCRVSVFASPAARSRRDARAVPLRPAERRSA